MAPTNACPPMNRLILLLALAVASVSFPGRLAAQLVHENPRRQASDPQDAQNSSARHGKKRLSQEIQLTGKLRYADAKEDNGPEGLGRGFKDLLRVLPFNDAGRGALIGRIGDQDTAQPFLIGAQRDVLAPVSGRLSVGINQTTIETGGGTLAVRMEPSAPAY